MRFLLLLLLLKKNCHKDKGQEACCHSPTAAVKAFHDGDELIMGFCRKIELLWLAGCCTLVIWAPGRVNIVSLDTPCSAPPPWDIRTCYSPGHRCRRSELCLMVMILPQDYHLTRSLLVLLACIGTLFGCRWSITAAVAGTRCQNRCRNFFPLTPGSKELQMCWGKCVSTRLSSCRNMHTSAVRM